MIGSRFFFFGTTFLLLQLLPGILGWGKEGHYAICKIAEGLLTEDAAAAVKMLLPEIAQGELAAVCSWADEVRFHYRWSGPLHYVDTPDFRCNYEYCRDCHDSGGHKDRCVTGGIYNYTMQLQTYEGSLSDWKYNLTEALMFLSHFIGDVHQPLHVGFLGDLGGNTIPIRWFRRKTNLHHHPNEMPRAKESFMPFPYSSYLSKLKQKLKCSLVDRHTDKKDANQLWIWDNMIIETAESFFYNSDFALMIEAIQRNIKDDWSADISSWENCASADTVCPDPYASESIKLACKYAYKGATPGSTLSGFYFLSRLPIVEKRLAQAGVRLASTLNRIFKPQMLISEA